MESTGFIKLIQKKKKMLNVFNLKSQMNVSVLVPKAVNQMTQAQKVPCNKFSFKRLV